MTDSQGIVVPPGEGAVLDMSPGRAAALKLQSGETGESIMVFEEAAPAGTATSYHIHHNSDEVAYVLSGEITFKIGDTVTVGGPAPSASWPRALPQAWRSTGAETAGGRLGTRPPTPGDGSENRHSSNPRSS